MNDARGHDAAFDDSSRDEIVLRDALAKLGPAPPPPPLRAVMQRARRDSRRRRGVWALSGTAVVVAAGATAVALSNRDGGGTSRITVTSPPQDTSDDVAVTTTVSSTTVPSTTAPPVTDAPAGATRRHVDTFRGFSVDVPTYWEQKGANLFGDDGMLVVSMLSAGLDLQTKAQLAAEHKLRPYGTQPTITETAVGGQPAMVIEPSADAPLSYGHLPAEVIVQMPEAVVGRSTVYAYLSLHVDVGHLEMVLTTLTFP